MNRRNYPPRDDAGQPIHDYREIRAEFLQMKIDRKKFDMQKADGYSINEIDCQHKGAGCEFPNCHCETKPTQK